jgi:putative tryptophan/tyrosine transport system substrate-binding protein
LSRPGGNVTGFMTFEYGMAAKWLEILRQIAPSVTRVAVLRDTQGSGPAAFRVIKAAAPSLDMTPVDTIDPVEIERGITSFAQGSNGGLIVTGSNSAAVHRKLIVTLAASYRLPAVYSFRSFVVVGGLISYGIKSVIQFRQAAGYVDRILKGERPAELPVQAPTSFELVIDLNTAKALGLTIPETLLATADEVIQ